jgi:hypothetical protein
MERLRVQGHVGEQHVIHLRHRPGQAVMDGSADSEILEIEAASRVPAFIVHDGDL